MSGNRESGGWPPVSPWIAGPRSRCPRCGKGALFDGFLTVRESCDVCGLDLSKADSGDGPAIFIMLVLGFVVTGLALWVEVTFSPPYWVHAVLWTPLIALGSIGLLRPFKATLIALQYVHRAAEGRLEDSGDGHDAH
ncbi:MAG: DUF983 domain-containing protein [Alphaproteobacteria bacterium]|nr:MAG: DUF983 domain-containing protein [Alphaproteobacteria bacterium]